MWDPENLKGSAAVHKKAVRRFQGYVESTQLMGKRAHILQMMTKRYHDLLENGLSISSSRLQQEHFGSNSALADLVDNTTLGNAVEHIFNSPVSQITFGLKVKKTLTAEEAEEIFTQIFEDARRYVRVVTGLEEPDFQPSKPIQMFTQAVGQEFDVDEKLKQICLDSSVARLTLSHTIHLPLFERGSLDNTFFVLSQLESILDKMFSGMDEKTYGEIAEQLLDLTKILATVQTEVSNHRNHSVKQRVNQLNTMLSTLSNQLPSLKGQLEEHLASLREDQANAEADTMKMALEEQIVSVQNAVNIQNEWLLVAA